jgi:hypothetical protein
VLPPARPHRLAARVTGSISGCRVVSHGGAEAVAVARSTAIPLLERRVDQDQLGGAVSAPPSSRRL